MMIISSGKRLTNVRIAYHNGLNCLVMTITITETAFISHARTEGEVTHSLTLYDNNDHHYYPPRNETPVGPQLPTPLRVC